MTGKIWYRWGIIVLLSILVTSFSPVLAQEVEGWAISPGESPESTVRLGESADYTVTVYNNKDFPAVFYMSAKTPQPGNLTPGYEPIPDTTLITFSPQQDELAPYSYREVTVTIAGPSAEDWGGKSYECWLGATFEAMGILQVELDCRLLLAINPAYAKGIDWVLAGVIAGAAVVAGGMVYSNRRNIKRWAGRW